MTRTAKPLARVRISFFTSTKRIDRTTVSEKCHTGPPETFASGSTTTAAAHVIGRVTCPVKGKDGKENSPQITPGFFHLPRSIKTKAIGLVECCFVLNTEQVHNTDKKPSPPLN
mmetsp:Transcript_16931/g.23810  ORF Transcript_16931/g.23810 Transcript_16931/m.23810 type:complete len:114 (-) Transcript_16931:2-343(-)